MLSGIGGTTPYDSGRTNGKGATPRNADSLAALTSEIRSAQSQLEDWTTCVSAKTTKGQAEIQKFSGQVSAAKERAAQIEAQSAASQATPVQTQPSRDSLTATTSGNGPTSDQRSGVLLDTWA
jgi:hypothetical protein